MIATITRYELKAKLDRGDRMTLIEALPEDYFRRAHIPGAVNIPINRVKELAPRLVPDKNADVIVYLMNNL